MQKSDENAANTPTYTEAIRFLIDLARTEADTLALATKMYEGHETIAPTDVRRAAWKRKAILQAIEAVQGGE